MEHFIRKVTVKVSPLLIKLVGQLTKTVDMGAAFLIIAASDP